MTTADLRESWVWLARIRRPQGRKGEVFAELLTDFPEKFAERRRVWLLSEKAAAEPLAAELGRLLAAQGRRGAAVCRELTRSPTRRLLPGSSSPFRWPSGRRRSPDEVHIADLIGCTVVDVATELPRVLGEIENVERAAWRGAHPDRARDPAARS